ELKEKSIPLKRQIQDLEEKIRLIQKIPCSEGEIRQQIEELFRDVKEILNAVNLTNEMLKQIIQKIEVDEYGHVEVFLKKIGGE
ncbi:MAG: hypothetical protein SPF91_08770, partial [Clostridium sp.]|nr:hypothetical protein [Clostridium sp.]